MEPFLEMVEFRLRFQFGLIDLSSLSSLSSFIVTCQIHHNYELNVLRLILAFDEIYPPILA